MNRITKIYTFALTILLTLTAANTYLLSQDYREKVLIYYFSDNSTTTKYSYYSYIIPDSIAVEIKKAKQFNVQTFASTMKFVDTSLPESENANYLKLLIERGNQFSADYIIIGSYKVENRKIYIKSQIFNVKEQKISPIDESSSDLGAILFVILDNITEKINDELKKSYKEKVEELGGSPFVSLYNKINGVSFGLNYGNVYFLGKWSDIYDSTEIISAYIYYDMQNSSFGKNNFILKNSAFSIVYDYFNTEKGHSSITPVLNLWGITLNYSYLFRLSRNFSLPLSLGIGGAKSDLIVIQNENQGPIGKYIEREQSMDPYLSLSISMKFYFDPIEINTGMAYKKVFYSDEYMDFRQVFFGLGYRI